MLSTLFFAVFAGLVAILVTVAIEKWGGIIGGILGTVPTTIIPAAAGIMLEGDNLSVAWQSFHRHPHASLFDNIRPT